MTTVAFDNKGYLRLRARIADISRHDCWHNPFFLSQFVARTYIAQRRGHALVQGVSYVESEDLQFMLMTLSGIMLMGLIWDLFAA